MMPSSRTRHVDDTHPVAGWLFKAADLGTAQTLALFYDTPQAAKFVARQLRRFRERNAIAAAGTFEPTPADPKGEGRGFFDHIEIRLKGDVVELGTRRATKMPAPMSVEIQE